MSEDTLPMIDTEERIKFLLQSVADLQRQIGTLARQTWIREQEVRALQFEVHALRLRILELEEEKDKGRKPPNP